MGIDTRDHRKERDKASKKFISEVKKIYNLSHVSFTDEVWSSDDDGSPLEGCNVVRVTAYFSDKDINQKEKNQQDCE
ncbi:unnamed protein product [marine sediment metagenome]|uniref:Uncharacterized protein n=1 Tax=marine sediment metagenome TaxID=412755 RepID=X1FQJ2_9ZZZZ